MNYFLRKFSEFQDTLSPEKIRSFMDSLKPENCVTFLLSKTFESLPNLQTDPLCEAKFMIEDIEIPIAEKLQGSGFP